MNNRPTGNYTDCNKKEKGDQIEPYHSQNKRMVGLKEVPSIVMVEGECYHYHMGWAKKSHR